MPVGPRYFASKPTWISVEDEEPPLGINVLCYSPAALADCGQGLGIGAIHGEYGKRRWSMTPLNHKDLYYYPVTHWVALPDVPPKEA